VITGTSKIIIRSLII